MPIREYRIDGTDRWIEVLMDGEPPETIDLSDGGTATLCRVPVVARTATQWGDTNQKPHYNRGLRKWVSGDREAQQIAKARGLVNHRELGTEREVDEAFDSYVSRTRSDQAAEDAEQAEYQENLTRFGGNAQRAAAETWSMQRVANGATVYARD